MKLWYKYYHLLYLFVCWIKAKDIKSLEMPCNLSCWCVIRMFFLTMLFLTTWGIYMLMNLTWRWRNLWCAWNTNYYEFLHLSYEQKKDITSWPWCWIPNSRSCGFPLLMWVVCNLSFGGYLWQVVVITFVGGMLQVFDAYYVWWTSKSSCNEQWKFVFSHQHFETCTMGAWLILLVSCWWKESLISP
jgi:hypothetical protein